MDTGPFGKNTRNGLKGIILSFLVLLLFHFTFFFYYEFFRLPRIGPLLFLLLFFSYTLLISHLFDRYCF